MAHPPTSSALIIMVGTLIDAASTIRWQVINHGIEKELLETMERVAKEFFMLPLEEKEKYPMAPGTIQGYGHAFVFSEDQKLDWCNMLALGVEPAFIRKPHLWPTNPANLRYFHLAVTATEKNKSSPRISISF